MRLKTDNISKNITFAEATRSETAKRHGIDNTPTANELKAMRLLAEKVFEPLREWYGKPIMITSFYRNAKVNAKAGGSSTSQHCKGEAIDIDTAGDNAKLFEYIRQNLDFDQLIWEYGDDKSPAWIHVSYKAGWIRGQVLRAVRDKAGKTIYKAF